MRLMIVDDDRQIREGITYGIEWGNLGIDHAECFRNGLEALDAFKREFFDIVLTDISMPGMSGIELMKGIKNLSPMTAVVLISGYEEFEYARAAIKYGAQDYILKPIHLDKVTEIIQEIINRAMDERKIHYMAKESEKTKGFQVLMNRWKSENSVPAKEVQSYLAETCSFGDPGPFLELLIEDDRKSGYFADSAAEKGVRQKITEIFAGHKQCIISVDNNRELVVLHAPASALYLFNLKNMAQRLKREINAEQAKEHSLSVSLVGTLAISEFFDGYDSCLQQMELRYFRGGKQFYSSDEQSDGSADRDALEMIFEQLTKGFERLQIEEHQELCRKAEKELRLLSRGEVENYVFLQLQEADSKGFAQERPEELIQQLRQCENFSDTMDFWIRKLDEIKGKAIGIDGLSKEVQEALLFIQRNYEKRITTEDVAEHLHMSSGHLSRLFRKELNESPKRYINLYRIRIAENLLRTTNMKIYEVADQVGISDYKYFAQVFKNITGVKPLDIRKGTDGE